MSLHGMNILQYAANEMTMGEKGIASAKVILTGFVVVFAVLLLLIFIIKLYSSIITKIQNESDKRKNRKTVEIVSKPAVQAKKSTYIAPPDSARSSDEIPQETIAVISAAVAVMYGSSGKARIKSIKKSDGGRSAWANAGVLDNTRPF